MIKLKLMIKTIDKDKEIIKLDITKIFTQIRNIINEREYQLLLEIDNNFEELFSYKEISKEGEKLSNKIKKSLDKSE